MGVIMFIVNAWKWLVSTTAGWSDLAILFRLLLALIAGLVYLLYRKYGAPPIIANIFWNASKGKIRLRRYKKTR